MRPKENSVRNRSERTSSDYVQFCCASIKPGRDDLPLELRGSLISTLICSCFDSIAVTCTVFVAYAGQQTCVEPTSIEQIQEISEAHGSIVNLSLPRSSEGTEEEGKEEEAQAKKKDKSERQEERQKESRQQIEVEGQTNLLIRKLRPGPVRQRSLRKLLARDFSELSA